MNNVIRVTGVPRKPSPGAAFHPVYFYKKYSEKICVIPGNGEALGKFELSYSERILPSSLPLNIVKLAFLFELFFRFLILKKNDKKVYVHSFYYCLPLVLSGCKPVLVIHGSDHKYLGTKLGRFIRSRLTGLYIVGKHDVAKKFEAISIPNIFPFEPLIEKTNRQYDFTFILRDSEVKNPKFPQLLYAKIPSDINVNIVVIGLEGIDLSNGNKKIGFKGVLPNESVREILRSTKTFVLPSLEEGIPKAVLEALSCGCNVVANNGVQLPEEINNEVTKLDCINNIKADDFLKTLNFDQVDKNITVARNYFEKSLTQLNRFYEYGERN